MVFLLAAATAAPAYDLHFDYTSFESTFGQSQFDVLNYPSINGNYMMTSTDNHRPEMVANGNKLAEFYNFLQQRYQDPTNPTKDGNLSADQIDAYVVTNSTNNGPKPNWLILNEISASLWPPNAGPPSNSTYRTWLVDCVTRLHEHYGYNVVTLAPYQNPGSNNASWQALAEVSYIGIECYLSGTEVWNSGTNDAQRLTWAQAQYQASKNSYLNRGVPESRLFLTEHFANNDTTFTDGQGNVLPTGWGRAGLASAANWDSVIQIRQDAILNVGFEGFLAYNWGGNGMGVTQAEQIQHEYYYRTRRVLESQKPQWLSDAAPNVNGTIVPLSWNQTLNWLGGVPNAVGAEANFWRTLTTNRSIALDGTKTVGMLTFDSPFSYTINPGTGGSLVLNNSGGAATLTSDQGTHAIAANVQLASNLHAAINAGTFTMSGVVSGAGGLSKSGTGTLALTGANTYAGDTVVQAGKLIVASSFLADSSDVYLSTGSTLDLNFMGSPDVIGSLLFNDVSQAVGTWGSVLSDAEFTSSLLRGTGTLQVTGFFGQSVPGDYNRNGVVDAADYVVWRNGLGTMFGPSAYGVWLANFGRTAGNGATEGSLNHVHTPEPESWLIGLLAIIAMAVIRANKPGSASLI
ncbi:MAG: autotransporter-associated beta strand repeat-containing protein [Pirellulales bacterium]